jgi:hypothetical protein
MTAVKLKESLLRFTQAKVSSLLGLQNVHTIHYPCTYKHTWQEQGKGAKRGTAAGEKRLRNEQL